MFTAGEIVASVIPSPPLGTDAAAGLLAPGAATGAGPTGAVAERRFRFELAAHPGSPAQARRLTRRRLTGWSVCEDTCDTAALVVSELVTNAIVHTASNQIVCELLDGDDLVRISVRDEGCAPGEPHPSPQRPEEEHGRGLLLVEALCHAWGAQEQGPGLVVWAELPRATGPAEASDGPPDARELPAPHVAPAPVAVPASHGAPAPTGAPDAVPGAVPNPHAAREAQDVREAQPVREDVREVRGDLGWGARPKPAPARQPGHEDDPRAARETRKTAQAGQAGHSGQTQGAAAHPPYVPLGQQSPHGPHGHSPHLPHPSQPPQGLHGAHGPQKPHGPHTPPAPHVAPHLPHGPQGPHGSLGPQHPAQTPHFPQASQGTRPQEPHGTGAVWL
nr:hypothetical protein StreXyl84_48450 [Streptomyces sp. Xyl84]